MPSVRYAGVLVGSLSARRAWIEIKAAILVGPKLVVALRKESVDRNNGVIALYPRFPESLSARRAWIEMTMPWHSGSCDNVALRKESVDRNAKNPMISVDEIRRSPQGERG